jgi:hypothetical protein
MNEDKLISSQEQFESLIYKVSEGKFNLTFSECTFECEIEARFQVNVVSFNDCIFKEPVSFHGEMPQGANFSNTVFEKSVNFSNINFKGKTRFHSTEFKGAVRFNNTKFENLADFWNSKFYAPTIFYKTDFMGTTVFARTHFFSNVLFTYTLIEKTVIFRGTIFDMGLDLSLAIIKGNLNIFDINLNDFVTAGEKTTEEEYEKHISENGIIPSKNKQETYKILKKQLQNQGNYIDAVTFSSFEFHAYFTRLNRLIFKHSMLKDNLQNWIILCFNYLSNRNGRSWIRGVAFTLLVGLLFFYPAIISTGLFYFSFKDISISTFSESAKLYLTFLTPTHKLDMFDNYDSSVWTYVWDYLGRIFVAYGIYQTIQAFRKFKSS